MTFVRFKNSTGAGKYPLHTRDFNFPSFLSDSIERLWKEDNVNWMPSANIIENENDFRIDLAVPGLEKKDFSIEVDGNELVISGERTQINDNKNGKMTSQEFQFGTFRRKFTLPETADENAITASYLNGILSVSIGKKAESKAQPKKHITVE